MRILLWITLFILSSAVTRAADNWQEPLSRMPLETNVNQLNRSNCVQLMLSAFRSNDVVKALIFMPGATDEFYMFKRASATLTNSSPTLLDAVTALTNQTEIRVTFLPPMLLLHTDEDPLEPLFEVKNESTVAKLKKKSFLPHAQYYDKDWEFLFPIFTRKININILPKPHTRDTFHFYRHSFAGWNLTAWEAIEALSLAGKTKFTVKRGLLVFDADTRVRKLPEIHSPARK